LTSPLQICLRTGALISLVMRRFGDRDCGTLAVARAG